MLLMSSQHPSYAAIHILIPPLYGAAGQNMFLNQLMQLKSWVT